MEELLKFKTEFLNPSLSSKITDKIENNNNNSCNEDQKEAPDWLDLNLIKSGQKFIRKYFFVVFFAHFISLICLLAYIPVQKVLLKTEKSNSSIRALRRYVSTFLHIRNWYEGDYFSQKNSHKSPTESIKSIRRLHYRIAKNLGKTNKEISNLEGESGQNGSREKLKIEDLELLATIRHDFVKFKGILPHESESELIINQLDMSVTQFCFMGLLTMFPSKFGISDSVEDRNGLNGFIHLWALIGYCLGIPNKFNICLPQHLHTHKIILHHILLPSFTTVDFNTLKLWHPLIGGVSKLIPFVSLKALLVFIRTHILNQDTMAINQTNCQINQAINCEINYDEKNRSDNLGRLMSCYDQICYKITEGALDSWMQENYYRREFLNWLLRWAIYLGTHLLGLKYSKFVVV